MNIEFKDALILGIESSCDETSAAVVKNGREVFSNVISSQIEIHKRYGGVVPEIASRKHIEAIDVVIKDAIDKSGYTFEDIDAIAVTYGPGLVGALLVGLSEAKALSYALKKPLIGVHHIEGHICANYIETPSWKPPFICLVVSGGHTHLVNVKSYFDFEIIGKTRDDAVGEAFDKVARAMGLSYPGGPMVDKMALNGNPNAVDLPRVMLASNDFDFSFSGLKSAVLNYLNKAKMMNEEINYNDLAASFQQAAVDVLCSKTLRACKEYNINKVALAGGVSANSFLRKSMIDVCENADYELSIPKPVLCTDNAAMIASAAYFEFINNNFSDMSLNAYPSLRLGDKI